MQKGETASSAYVIPLPLFQLLSHMHTGSWKSLEDVSNSAGLSTNPELLAGISESHTATGGREPRVPLSIQRSVDSIKAG